MRVYNFSAGPAALPLPVLEQARDELLEWQGGASVMELSHRSRAFIAVAERAEADLRELLAIPPDYRVLFMQGGATAQFALVPMNLAAPGAAADYVNTGHWSARAIQEARRYVSVNVAADEAASAYTTVPDAASLQPLPGSAYLHYTPNETIGGVELPYIPETGDVPLVADMSSHILSRVIEVAKSDSLSTVVWNPWIEKAKRMSDFGDDEWPQMLCIEAANTGRHRIELAPSARHATGTTISAEPL